jgi:plastocyanin
MNLMRLGVLLLVGLVLVTLGCTSRPFRESSLTGRIVEVNVGKSVVPKEIIVKQGDEVRWGNTTSSAMDVSFIKPLDAAVSCQRGIVSPGWGYLFGGSNYLVVATVYSHEFASLCFSVPGTYVYTVRTDKAGAGKAGNRTAGSVTVE